MLSSSTSLAFLFFTIATAIAAAKEFQVGDAVGWRIPATNETELYNVWASRRRFYIGDSLRFCYKSDSVVMVNKWGLYHCDLSNPIASFNDGNTLINLDKAGTLYFISGDSESCKKGQKMIVNVMNLHHFPPSIATPPINPYYSSMSPSPSPSQHSNSGTCSDSMLAVLIVNLMVLLVGLGFCLVHS